MSEPDTTKWTTSAKLDYLIARSEYLEKLMSVLSDTIKELSAATDSAIARVQEDVATLNAKIAELQTKVDQGLATPEDMVALRDTIAKVNALDPVKPDTLPTT